MLTFFFFFFSYLGQVHIPSCTVFQNWPTTVTALGTVEAVAFTNGGGNNMLAVGDEGGKIRLWDIRP